LSALRKPATVVNPPPVRSVFAAKNNANNSQVSRSLYKFIQSIRRIRKNKPGSLTWRNLSMATAANRNAVNRAIANYVLNVNKARKLNNIANQAIRQGGPVSPTVFTQAARANNQVLKSRQSVQNAVQQTPSLSPLQIKYSLMTPRNLSNQVYYNLTPNNKKILAQAISNRLKTTPKGTQNSTNLLVAQSVLGGKPPLPPKPPSLIQPQPNANFAWLQQLGNRNLTNAEFNRVKRILNTTKIGPAKNLAANKILKRTTKAVGGNNNNNVFHNANVLNRL